VFLLIMGGVTALVLSNRLASQFNVELNDTAAAAASRAEGLAALAANKSGYIADAVSPRTGQAVVLTPGRLATGLRALLSGMTVATYRAQFGRAPATLTLPGGQKLRAVARVIPARELAGAGYSVSPGAFLLVVARPASAVDKQVTGVIVTELITGGALIALLAIGGESLIGRGLEPLDEMASTANEITLRGDLAERMTDADDRTEVGRLGSAINVMLDRIQQAFGARMRSEQKVREFAADASHELRTPLTTVRGYAELYRQGALGPDQLPNAMRRIEQEAHRMSLLVAELLELARLDRTSTLDLSETDLAGLVRDAVADAVAVEPARPARAEAPPRLVALVDEPRIRQVLANLLGNVRAHTPTTTPVAVRLGAFTGGVLIEVADAGPGMSEADAARAFDRFHRGTDRGNGDAPAGRTGHAPASASGHAPASASGHTPASASGHTPADEGAESGRSSGSGLGLSIVQAIAAAHGGNATLESWPGRGTRVRVWLAVRTAP
jgi:two-component system OmpR family sensor kinase